MNESYRVNDALSNITQWIVLIYQAIAVVLVVASLFLGLDWLRNPFIGGLFEQTMVLNGTDTREPGKQWALYAQGFEIGDQLVSVNGAPLPIGVICILLSMLWIVRGACGNADDREAAPLM
jgi:hypothetical protein